MRIAIFYDAFENAGGGEKLILTLARGLGADVISANVNRQVIEQMGFSDVNVLSLGDSVKLPPLKQMQMSWMFSRADIRGKYDFFIFSGNWAHYASFRHKPNLWYCLTPTRPFYDLYRPLLEREGFLTGLFFRAWVFAHRRFDQIAVARCEKIVSDSKNVQSRVKKYYGRESAVVYPPIDTKRYHYRKNGDFWLSVNRLYPEKRVGLQIEAFRELPKERLVIVGGHAKGDHASGYVKSITEDLPKNVELRGNVSEEELIGLYADCKGLITTAMDEDFGMTPLEAMASGKPVVAVNEGGYKETVIDGKTGRLIPAEKSELISAIREISLNAKKYKGACLKKAFEFDLVIFINKMKHTVGKSAIRGT